MGSISFGGTYDSVFLNLFIVECGESVYQYVCLQHSKLSSDARVLYPTDEKDTIEEPSRLKLLD